MPNNKTIIQEANTAINDFIMVYVPKSYAHLIDSDDNAGERLRKKIKTIITNTIKTTEERTIQECIELVREFNHGSFLGEPVLNKKTVLSALNNKKDNLLSTNKE